LLSRCVPAAPETFRRHVQCQFGALSGVLSSLLDQPQVRRLLSFEGEASDKGSVLRPTAGDEFRAVSVASFGVGFRCWLRLSAMIFVARSADWHRCAYSANWCWTRSPSFWSSARMVCNSARRPSISCTEVPRMRCTSVTAVLAASPLSPSPRRLALSRSTKSRISASTAASMA